MGKKESSKRSKGRSGGAETATTTVGGYKCLPVLKRVLVEGEEAGGSNGTDDVVEFKSCIYFRRHYGKRRKLTNSGENVEVEGKHASIFVTNLCHRVKAVDLKVLFGVCGKVVDVGFGSLRNPKKDGAPSIYAHVTFANEEEAEAAMALGKDAFLKTTWTLHTPEEGMGQWVDAYRESIPTLSELRSEADEYMEAFEQRLGEERKAMELRRQQADDDGFTVVKRKHTARKSGQQASNISSRRRKKRKTEGLTDFYRFQMKEGKRNDLAELREKFAEDRKKIARLKESNKFSLK